MQPPLSSRDDEVLEAQELVRGFFSVLALSRSGMDETELRAILMRSTPTARAKPLSGNFALLARL